MSELVEKGGRKLKEEPKCSEILDGRSQRKMEKNFSEDEEKLNSQIHFGVLRELRSLLSNKPNTIANDQRPSARNHQMGVANCGCTSF